MEDKSQALELKNLGNESFKAGKYNESIEYFTKAIQLDPNNHVLYSNRSACYINISDWGNALKDANKTIVLQPNWSRGYGRQGTAFLCLESWSDAANSFNRGLEHEPNSPELLKGIETAKFGKYVTSLLPQGIYAQVPIVYVTTHPFPIQWEIVDTITEILTGYGVNGLWAVSPASEMNKLSLEEALLLTGRVAEKCKNQNIVVLSGVNKQSDLNKYADAIKETYQAGASAVVLSVSHIAQETDSEETFLSNLKSIISLIGDIPIGLYESKEPYYRFISQDLLNTILNLRRVYFLIDTSGSVTLNKNRGSVIRTHHCGFRLFNNNNTTLLNCLEAGGDGYAGEGASFLPFIYVWLWKNIKAQPTFIKMIHAFLSTLEPTLQALFPVNLKIFLKLHENLALIEGITRQEMGTTSKMEHEEAILRLTHLHEAAKYIEQELKTAD